MSVTLSVIVGKKKIVHDIDNAEVASLSSLAHSENEKSALSLVFDEGQREVSLDLMRDATKICLLLSNDVNIPPIYTFTGRSSDGTPFLGARGISGIRIGSGLFSIWGGVDRCLLRKSEITAEGRGKRVAETDIRKLRSLETDNMGQIRINRRNRPARVVRLLRKVETVLGDVVDESLVKVEVS